MIRIGIVGATGYTALELLKILLRRHDVRVVQATSRGDAGQLLCNVHPALQGLTDLRLTEFDLTQFMGQIDCAFCCLPHAAASPVVKQLVDAGIRTIDFSADYRLSSFSEFESIYQAPHADPDRLGHVPYGLPELFRDAIESAALVANPGCFPTSVVLPLAPLLSQGLIDPQDIIVDSKTGISGAGRTPKLAFHFPECNESVAAYGVGTHRHRPEMETILERAAGLRPNILFTPHLVPMDRGILSTIYVRPRPGTSESAIRACWQAQYAAAPFVRLTGSLPGTKNVSGTNFCDLAVRQSGDRLVIVAAIDNLIKGASGAAVQNFNIMFGCDETCGLK